MRLLLDEMYPPRSAEALRAVGIDATTVAECRLAGAPDPEVFAAAQSLERSLLTENVTDFLQVVTQFSESGRHHHGLLIALSSRFSRRPVGIGRLVDSARELSDESLNDRVVYLCSVTG